MAAAKKSGLGKGLDSLITNKVGTAATTETVRTPEPDKDVTFVKIAKVEPNREQPRKSFDEDSLLELSESLKQYGILQPLLVQEIGRASCRERVSMFV